MDKKLYQELAAAIQARRIATLLPRAILSGLTSGRIESMN